MAKLILLLFLNSLMILHQTSSQSTASSTVGFIYIDTDPNAQIVMAQPHTLSDRKQATISILSSITTPFNYEISFVWSIKPENNQIFESTTGQGSIQSQSNQTQVVLSARDDNASQAEIVLYTFQLERVVLVSNSNQNNTNGVVIYLNEQFKSVVIRFLPSNYPFGTFQFSSLVPDNLTISIFSKSAASSLLVQRNYGLKQKVLVSYNQIEVGSDGKELDRSVNYLEFNENDSIKPISFIKPSTSSIYPKYFIISLTRAELLGQSSIRADDPVIQKAVDILPKIDARSSVYIKLIDDRSIIEFIDANLIININSRLDSTQSAVLTLSRSFPNNSTSSNNNDSVVVDFIIIPMYKNFNNKTFYPARAYLDYTPISGQFVFRPGNRTANFTLRIMPSDEVNARNYHKMIKLSLLGVQNCESCQFGSNVNSEIFINTMSYPFRNLLQWSASYPNVDMDSRTIQLNEPLFMSNKISNTTSTLTRLCLTSQTSSPIKLEFQLTKRTAKLDDQLRVDILTGGQNSLYFVQINSIICLDFLLEYLNNVNQSFYCYNLPDIYRVNLTLAYTISQKINYYSPIVSEEIFSIGIRNKNCSQASFDKSSLEKFNTNELAVNMNSIVNSSSKFQVQIMLDRSLNYSINVPISLRKNMANFSTLNLKYLLEIDSNLDRYLIVDEMDQEASYRVLDKKSGLIQQANVTRYTMESNVSLYEFNGSDAKGFIKFSLINIDMLKQFYLININLTLLATTEYDTSLLNQYNTDQGIISLVMNLILASSADESLLCGIISLNKAATRFVYFSNKRQLALLFSNELNTTKSSNRSCTIDVLYQITKHPSNIQVFSTSIFDYIEESSDNFEFLFSTDSSRNFKTIQIKSNDVYLDFLQDTFMINLTTLSIITADSVSLFRSISDTYLPIQPSIDVSNGPAFISARLNKQDESFYLNININRAPSFLGVQAECVLIFWNSRTNSIAYSESVSLRLKDTETNKTSVINLSSKSNINFYSDLILVKNSICYLNEIDLTIFCSPNTLPNSISLMSSINNDSYLVPDGIFKFNNTRVNVASSTSNVSLRIDRWFGSRTRLRVHMALVPVGSGFIDVIFDQLFYSGSSISFSINYDINIYMQVIVIKLSRKFYLTTDKRYYAVLTNTQEIGSGMYLQEKISQQDNRVEMRVSSRQPVIGGQEDSSYIQYVAALGYKTLIVPVFDDSPSELNVSIEVIKLGFVTTIVTSNNNIDSSIIGDNIILVQNGTERSETSLDSSSFFVRTAGYNQPLPDYVLASMTEPPRLANFAHENLDFQRLNLNVSMKSSPTRFILTVKPRFRSDYEPVDLSGNQPNIITDYNKFLASLSFYRKSLFLYLDTPSSDLRLIEPNSTLTQFSPFMRVEIRRFSIQSGLVRREYVEVGFARRSLNQTIFIQSNSLLTQLAFYLNSNQSFNNSIINGLYLLKYTAVLVNTNFSMNEMENQESLVNIQDILECPIMINQSRCQNVISCSVSSTNCTFLIKFRQNLKLYSNVEIRLELDPMLAVNFSTQFLDVSTSSLSRVAYLYIRSNSKYITNIGINKPFTFVIINRLTISVSLKLDRIGSSNETVRVFYTTRDFTNMYPSFFVDSLKFYTAISGYDYEPASGYLVFTPGETEKYIVITLRSVSVEIPLENYETNSSSFYSANRALYPRLFQVLLVNCTPNCAIDSKLSVSNINIINEYIHLWQVYKQILMDDPNLMSLDEIEEAANSPSRQFSPNEQVLIVAIIDEIIREMYFVLNSRTQLTINQTQINYRRQRMIGTLCGLLWSSKFDDFDLNLKLNSWLEDIFFSTIGGVNSTCQSDRLVNDHRILPCRYLTFYFYCGRFNYSEKSQEILYKGRFFDTKFPLSRRTVNNLTGIDKNCFDVCFIEYENAVWIQDSYNKLVNNKGESFLLNNRLLTISSRPIAPDGSSYTVTNSRDSAAINQFRSAFDSSNLTVHIVHLLDRESIQSLKECSIFDTDSKQWLLGNPDKYCMTLRTKESIECRCKHQSLYALVKQNEINYYGFNFLPLYVTMGFAIISQLTAIITYFLFLEYLYTFSSLCFIQLNISTLISQVLYLLIVVLSPSILTKDRNNARCMSLATFFHFFVLTQFAWIAVSCLNFYLLFSRKIALTSVYKILTFLFGWLLPVIIIVLFYLITSLVFELELNYSASFIYTDVLENSDFCFIRNIWVYLLSFVLPCSILFIIAIAFILLTMLDLKNWSTYEDIYPNRINRREIFLYFGFYALVITLFAVIAAQIRFGYYWMFVVVCLLEMIICVYMFLFYTLFRHVASAFFFNLNLPNPEEFMINLKMIVRRKPIKEQPTNIIVKPEDLELEDLIYILKSIEKGVKMKKSNERKLLQKPSISWVNNQDVEPNRAYSYYNNDKKKKQTTNVAVNDLAESSSTSSRKISLTSLNSASTQLEDLFEMTNC